MQSKIDYLNCNAEVNCNSPPSIVIGAGFHNVIIVRNGVK